MAKEEVSFAPPKRIIEVKVGSENRLFGLSQSGAMVGIKAKELQRCVLGFVPGKRTMPFVCYSDRTMSYHLYNGGEVWIPTMAENIGRSGLILSVAAKVLRVPDFVSQLPGIRMANDIGANWVADTIQLTGFDLKGNQLTIHFAQEPVGPGKSEFDVVGVIADSIGWGSVSGSYLDVSISDFFHTERTLRIYHDGHDLPSMGIRTGWKFGRVHFVSHDGVRLAIGYEKATGDFSVAYLYASSPSTLYSLDEIKECPLEYPVEGFVKSWKISQVIPRRDLEQTIAVRGQSNNDVGRIGAEIAYCVMTEKFRLPHVVMQDPSRPGPDLYTEDRRVVIEARLLQRTQDEESDELNEDVTKQLGQMVRKVNHDMAITRSAVMGYAIISLVDNQRAIRTIVLRV